MKKHPLQDPILRKDKAAFLGISLVSLLLALGGVIYVLSVWRTIPPDVGYHFAANGQFDLFCEKANAFWHPFIAQAVILVVFTLLGALCYHLKPLRRLSPTGHRITVCSVAHWCNLVTLAWIAFFVYWEHCVVTQTPMNTRYPFVGLWLLIATFVVLNVLLVFSFVRFRAKPTTNR